MAVVIETTIGDFTVDLYTKERPQTCRNFLKLCKIKYYNWSLFFTVQSNFIAQTGDPTATGKGGESVYGIVLGEKARYYEAEQIPKIKHDKAGLISMVNCGNNMLGSQFFITLASELQSLDGEHCVFGEITEGIDIILKFNEIICDVDQRPYQDVRISHTVILEDPYDDPQGLVIPNASPGPTTEMLTSERIAADEIIDDTEGMTVEEIVEMQKEKEAKARATILEIVGDIPDAEMAPPENVLFVCKLNPVTNDDDLEIIFSRFGKIVGCEVIRDKQSGDSLQYAFIEFAERKSCEDAYFKMDNVLIDDRRIHVDFSQSVAKMRWRGKGKGIKYFDQEDDEKKDKEKSKEIKKHRSQTNRDRSESPRKERNKYDSKKDSRRKQECSKNGDDRKRDSRRDDRDCKLDRKTRDKSQNRSRSNEKSRSKEIVRERSRDRRGRSKDKKNRSSERSRDRGDKSRDRSRERSRDRRDKSRDRSRERRDKKDRNDHECRNRSDRDSRNKDEKKKKKHKRHSSEEDDRHLLKRKQRKSRDRSEERHEKSSHKHKHKHKSR